MTIPLAARIIAGSLLKKKMLKRLGIKFARGYKALTGKNKNPKVKGRLNADSWLDTGKWVNVKSSNVSAIAYNSDTEQLFVEFGVGNKPKSYYMYPGVNRGMAKRFFNSPSFGKAIWKMFRWPGRPYAGPLGGSR